MPISTDTANKTNCAIARISSSLTSCLSAKSVISHAQNDPKRLSNQKAKTKLEIAKSQKRDLGKAKMLWVIFMTVQRGFL